MRRKGGRGGKAGHPPPLPSSSTPPLFQNLAFQFLYNSHVTVLKRKIAEHGGKVVAGGEEPGACESSAGAQGWATTPFFVVDPKESEDAMRGKLEGKGFALRARAPQPGDDAATAVVYVRSSWIVTCIKSGKLVPINRFLVFHEEDDESPPCRDQGNGARGQTRDEVPKAPETGGAEEAEEVDVWDSEWWSSAGNGFDESGEAPGGGGDGESRSQAEGGQAGAPGASENAAAARATVSKLRNFWLFSSSKDRGREDSPYAQEERGDVASTSNRGSGGGAGLEETEEPQPETNRMIVDELMRLIKSYQERVLGGDNNFFRGRAAKHAVSILSNPPYGFHAGARQIASAVEILKKEHGGELRNGVGQKTALKVQEILATTKLRIISEVKKDPMHQVLDQFLKIWGCGRAQALKWYTRGYRTVEEIAKAPDIKLTAMQQLGLRYYDSIANGVVSKEQMEATLALVNEVIQKLPAAEGLEAHLAGSYRRGKPSTHDVDILVLSENPDVVQSMETLVRGLHEAGLLLEFLFSRAAGKNKYKAAGAPTNVKSCMVMAICKFPLGGQIGRADIKLYHRSAKPFALLHCTGSAEFNRAMRWYGLSESEGMMRTIQTNTSAGRVRSWLSRKRKNSDEQKEVDRKVAPDPPNSLKLTDCELRPVFRERRGNRLTRNIIWEALPEDCIRCDSEEDVFRAMGLAYVPPELRKM